MGAIAHLGDAERRARLVARHRLARTADDPLAAVRSVVALHSSDPITPYLGAWARVRGFVTADLDRALVTDRSLWRLHAMRRTLFVVPADEASIFDAAAARDIASKERRRVEAWVAPALGKKRSAARWMADLEARVLERLQDAEQKTQDLVSAIPELGTEITLGSGKWATRAPIASRLLFLMAMDGRVVRTRASGSWRSSQYHWAATARWFAGPRPAMDAAHARGELLRRYLATHGPATETDVRWWTGWTAKQTSAAAVAIDARTVRLDGGVDGWVLAEDDDLATKLEPHVALLPGLDPAPMGWKERGWFLGPHGARLFDSNGNVGPTIWLDGRIVGGWASRPDATIVCHLLEDVGRSGVRRIEREAEALTTWMGGASVVPRFRTPLERELAER